MMILASYKLLLAYDRLWIFCNAWVANMSLQGANQRPWATNAFKIRSHLIEQREKTVMNLMLVALREI